MKSNYIILTIVLVTLVLLLVPGCKKNEDTPQPTKESISESVELVRADSLESYVQWLEGMGTRFLLADNHRQVAVKIKQKFIDFGYPETKLDSFALTLDYEGYTYNTWQYNVIATLPGKDYPDSICILGAHYDNNLFSGNRFDFIPGANDNASGVAAMLEIARLMHKMSFESKFSIRFVAFAAEEYGLFGSFDYCEGAVQEDENIVMMLNNDMIAGQVDAGAKPWKVNIADYSNSTSLRKEAEKTCITYTDLESLHDNSVSGRSDSYAFYLYDYKPIYFTQETWDNTYHTVNDLSTACNFEFCREITKISFAFLLEKNSRE